MATASLFEKVGVDVAVSPKKAALNEIKNRIVDYKEGLLATVEMGLAEILEINIPENFADTALMNLTLPKRGVIAIIQRGSKVIIPKRPDTNSWWRFAYYLYKNGRCGNCQSLF